MRVIHTRQQTADAPLVVPGVMLERTFSQNTLALDGSGRWYPRLDCELSLVVVSLDTAVTSGTYTVLIKRNGSTVATVDITSGSTFPVQVTSFTSASLTALTDYVSVEASALGEGAEDLVVDVYAQA